MKSVSLELPAMYADHHVIEVKRVLSELPGVGAVFASSAFHCVEIEYDHTLTSLEDIEGALDAAGYLSDLAIPEEVGGLAGEDGDRPFFRHTAASIQIGTTVNFTQDVPPAARPLWPCPGIGVVQRPVSKAEELENA